ncbi:hypothetical protein IMCC3317_02720 [Kordia antarctica]|uniref:Uncharacterized protein n=1 Tax=Kordia antarctica TaxID=1218801 RepID=A0A7L4ZE97_9FLAO|nr:hypothetical protein IMCC3317_02720 [Kordia antarctica]
MRFIQYLIEINFLIDKCLISHAHFLHSYSKFKTKKKANELLVEKL